jgi:hypothetical protein
MCEHFFIISRLLLFKGPVQFVFEVFHEPVNKYWPILSRLPDDETDRLSFKGTVPCSIPALLATRQLQIIGKGPTRRSKNILKFSISISTTRNHNYYICSLINVFIISRFILTKFILD